MRKDFKDRVFIKKFLYATYVVEGFNLDRLLNTLKKGNIDLYNVKKYSNKRMEITINLFNRKKLFAITKEMCYNIKKVKESGFFYPFLYFSRRIGVFLGALIFVGLTWFSQDFVFKIDYFGTGAVYKSVVEDILTEFGVSTFDRFSKIDLKKLSNDVLKKTDRFSFVSCYKHGNRLCIELVASPSSQSVISGDVYELKSPYSGTVESIKLYRGTAKVKEGDDVKEGDLLVDGNMIVKDQVVKTGVLAVVTILMETTFEVKLVGNDMFDYAVTLANESILGEVVHQNCTVSEYNDEFLYRVTTVCRRVISVG